MTLLLGLPGSGKSLLLKTLAGQVRKDARLSVTGDVMYNERNITTMFPERIAAYVDQVQLCAGSSNAPEKHVSVAASLNTGG